MSSNTIEMRARLVFDDIALAAGDVVETYRENFDSSWVPDSVADLAKEILNGANTYNNPVPGVAVEIWQDGHCALELPTCKACGCVLLDGDFCDGPLCDNADCWYHDNVQDEDPQPPEEPKPERTTSFREDVLCDTIRHLEDIDEAELSQAEKNILSVYRKHYKEN